ncbi:invasion regulator SirB1 [Buchnera aphidicola (Mindarus keteleerifoliae)]|uniref:invasion regulator SirB1 n=1 Tax=Buchnera aphidicola TaxID=9 RepID=UPI0031B72D56
MKIFSNIDFSKQSIFESMVVAFQLIRKNFPAEEVKKELKSRIKEIKFSISSENNEINKLKKMLQIFYSKWGFGGANKKYKLSDVLWIDSVLKTRQGTAVSLGIIILYIAKELELSLTPVIFPTQLILRSDIRDKKPWLIDPFNGETLNEHILEVWLKGNISPTALLYKNDLNEAKSLTVIRKILNTLKAALMEEKNMELALNVSNLLIQLDPNDPYEIRDRGLIYAQLECGKVALRDLAYFVEHCPEDPISEIIKVQIHSIEQKKITFH